jgi:hypothetical protein
VQHPVVRVGNIQTRSPKKTLYRRGMYTFIKLTVPPPSMIMFDASNRDQCEVKRSKTNTPLQALIMENESNDAGSIESACAKF